MIPKWSHSKISWRSRSAIHTISRIKIFPRSYHVILHRDLQWISNPYRRLCLLWVNVKIFFLNRMKFKLIQSFRRSRFEIHIRSFREILHRSCYEVTRHEDLGLRYTQDLVKGLTYILLRDSAKISRKNLPLGTWINLVKRSRKLN